MPVSVKIERSAAGLGTVYETEQPKGSYEAYQRALTHLNAFTKNYLKKETIMHILGIDVGGTGVKGAIIETATGKLTSERLRIQTPNPATPESIGLTVKGAGERPHWFGPTGIRFPAACEHGVARKHRSLFYRPAGGRPFFHANQLPGLGRQRRRCRRAG